MLVVMISIFTLIPFVMLRIIEKKAKNVSKVKLIVAIVYSIFELAFMFYYNILEMHFSFYNITSYFINYDLGFVSRGLVGSVFKLFIGYNENFKRNLIITYDAFVIVCYYAQLYLVYKVLKKIENNEKFKLIENYFFIWATSISTSVFYFITSYMNYTIINLSTEFLRTDIIAYLLILFMMIVLIKEKRKLIDYILVTLVSTIMIYMHQGIFFIYIPMIAFIFLYDAFYIEKRKSMKIIFVFFVLIVSISFLICQFVDVVSFLDLKNYIQRIMKEQCKLPFNNASSWMLQMEYDSSIMVHRKLFFGIEGTINYCREGLFMICFYYPVLLFLAINMIKKYEIKINKKLFILYVIYVVVIKGCLYVLTVDWFRWITFDFQCITFAFMYFVMKDILLLKNKKKDN